MATLRLVRAAERAGVRRFVFFSALNARHHSRTRFFRAKALAEEAVKASAMETTVFRPSIIYTPGDPWLTLLDRLSRLPAVPVSGSGRAVFEPVWAEDVADAVVHSLRNGAGDAGYDLAGPELLSYDDIVRIALRASQTPPQAAPRAAAGRARLAQSTPPRGRPEGLRHLGGGGADGGADGLRTRNGGHRAAGCAPLPMPAVLGSDPVRGQTQRP